MSKAILVLDEMPENCSDCPVWEAHDDWGEYVGRCAVKNGRRSRTIHRPSWCPLEPMPEGADLNAPETSKSYIVRTQLKRIIRR